MTWFRGWLLALPALASGGSRHGLAGRWRVGSLPGPRWTLFSVTRGGGIR
jgi:hypothetical protein